jgi:hypothetical protein
MRPLASASAHDTDAYYKIAHAFVDGEPSGNLTLDNITTYWLTGPAPLRPCIWRLPLDSRPARLYMRMKEAG